MIPKNWLEICSEEVERGKLTSLPLKLKFAEQRGMKDIDEVHKWMLKTHKRFVELINKAKENLK